MLQFVKCALNVKFVINKDIRFGCDFNKHTLFNAPGFHYGIFFYENVLYIYIYLITTVVYSCEILQF